MTFAPRAPAGPVAMAGALSRSATPSCTTPMPPNSPMSHVPTLNPIPTPPLHELHQQCGQWIQAAWTATADCEAALCSRRGELSHEVLDEMARSVGEMLDRSMTLCREMQALVLESTAAAEPPPGRAITVSREEAQVYADLLAQLVGQRSRFEARVLEARGVCRDAERAASALIRRVARSACG